MDVVSACPLPVASVLWQPRPGSWVLTVVCKATYLLAPGEARLAPEQDRPRDADAHWDEDDAKSLRFAADLAPFKPRADIVVVGHAHAPRKQPAASLVARLLVGDVDKAVEVVSDRGRAPDGSIHEGPRFTRMPLHWERAAGGPGTANPVGMPANAWPNAQGLVPLPNLRPQGLLPGAPIPPIGFGPIAPAWPARIEKLGRWAASFSHRTWMDQPIPEGIDRSYFNVAPADQQLDALRGNERLILECLHPEHARLITTLPGDRPRASIERGGGAREEVDLHADTLVIDSDEGRAMITWRAQVRLDQPHQPGRITVSLAGGAAPMIAGGHTIDASALAVTPGALPFAPSAGAPPRSDPTPAAGLPFGASARPATPIAAPPIASPPIAPPPIAPPPIAPPPIAPPPIAPPPIASPPIAPPPPIVAPPAWSSEPAPARPAANAWSSNDLSGAGLSIGQRVTAQAVEVAPSEVDAGEEAGPDTARPAAPPARERITLIWRDAKLPARLRRKPSFRRILDALEDEDPDEDLDSEEDDGATRDVLAVLARGAPLDAPGLHEAVTSATRRDGTFVPPLVLLAGEVLLPFDERATLEATAAAVAPLAGDDKQLEATVDMVGALLATPWLQGAGGGAEHLTSRLKEAFAPSLRALPAGYLESHTERVLLEKRCFQRRTILGRPQIRALFRPLAEGARQGGEETVPTYLPGDLAELLPMFQRFGARLLAEVHTQQDQHEAHPLALRVLAIARTVAIVPRR